MSEDMANMMMIHGTWELKWGKRVIYPSVRETADCKKDVSNEYRHKKSTHLEHDEMQCKTEVTNTLRTEFVKLKVVSNMLQNPDPRDPNGFQNPF